MMASIDEMHKKKPEEYRRVRWNFVGCPLCYRKVLYILPKTLIAWLQGVSLYIAICESYICLWP